MPNAVYTLSLQALARSVSERGADALLTAALRERQLSPEDVTAAQMQLVLAGPLVHRLSTILSPEQARAELSALSTQLDSSFSSTPTLFTDVGTLNDWDTGPAVSEWTGEGDLRGGNSGVTATREAATQDTAIQDTGSAVATDPAPDHLGADDFEFDDPEYAAAPSTRHYALNGEAGQDALIRDLGRMPGVLGVMVTRENGEVLRVKALRDVTQLGSVMAATGLLLRQRGLKLLAADLGQQTVCMRPLGPYSVAVIAGPQVNVGRLLTELQQLEASG
ncbi:roadblock/LC7 domain-containing protein [Deinococcus radiodurans]|jgi:Roadblock/LC7 domain.|nr:roadblock/LC7 domain-containing protein [Deinococcus radiodurans]ANC72662.1 hypothetical protein A2G07_01835 [Deinococcus radiodurans R1 = ATCC 13939 = DSM 20539]QIP28014.1 roadblock/LC7 domain-containing protein [Deinococcus radiodurans]QIP31104.1 roadblock/LC7 domain-containing protein [Deinococcus radiodurans]UID71306.1 hypothetical protein DRO_2318 [Deinococcus radiodurans R1 = ATCC 13939 = DSM 20539]UTA51656.1 roadblock/LC7 domain-containing protein [Deinococcus radiodurans]